ncbi:glycerophosphodiester phosphodiesterase family protein [Plantactinospora soyae]|uniref:Glycerophosphoryl diester phosphodiesterase n=1 Tax=Plantactinospora soyae TaxID=1544732 RepID=A0A927MAJ3_9ACTN|nr:glycerophosphodiester phosphodiesterase family protein [Plantactinospora soyae]MBE1489626.1 glycerophosphoryl diester phosphodiesterase [Plantactinospora soyae]
MLAVVLTPALATPSAQAEPRTPTPSSDTAGFLDNGITAHRGYSGAYPENTMTSMRQGIRVGADWIELDVFLSKDGQVVVSHDRTTARVGDKNLVIADSTYKQLRTVDVAWAFRDSNGLTAKQVPVERMPLLSDVLRMVKQQHRTRVSIQPKESAVVEASVDVVHQLGMQDWVGFNDGSLPLMTQVKQLDPSLHVFWDTNTSDIDGSIATAVDRGFETIVMNQAHVSPESIQKIRAAGMEAGAWTINDFAVMQRFFDWGIDRVYTDHAAEALQLRGHDDRTGIRRGLLGHWSFDDHNGDFADDDGSVNQLRQGRLVANAAFAGRGRLRGGVTFQGHRDYVDVPIEVLPDAADRYTTAAWFKPARAGVPWRQSILETSGAGAISVELSEVTGQLKYSVQTTGTSVIAESDRVPAPGAWHHVAVSYDQATGMTRLYLDGGEVTSFVDARETATGALVATDGLHIGAYRDANDRFFEGTLDDVAVWDRVLTTTELGWLWNAGRGNAVPST